MKIDITELENYQDKKNLLEIDSLKRAFELMNSPMNLCIKSINNDGYFCLVNNNTMSLYKFFTKEQMKELAIETVKNNNICLDIFNLNEEDFSFQVKTNKNIKYEDVEKLNNLYKVDFLTLTDEKTITFNFKETILASYIIGVLKNLRILVMNTNERK